jgi:hypothetical protein
MAQVSQQSPELASGVLQLARALLAAARNWTLYPREHPAVGRSIARLSDAVRQTSGGAIFSPAVTPDTLLVEGAPADRTQTGIAEASALLHDRDIIQITFIGEVPAGALQSLLTLLALDAGERRRRGGPASIWADDGHPSMAIAVVTAEHPLDPFRPQVKIISKALAR